MSGADWSELERAWQSLPAVAAPAVEELKRQRRWQWWSTAYVAGEVVVAIGGFAAGGWLLSRGDPFSIVIGLTTIVFVASVSAASYWARSLMHEQLDSPVMQTVASAVRRVETGIRLASATLWSVCGALAWLAVFAAAVPFLGTASDHAKGYVAIALALVFLAAVLTGTIVYQQRRTADLARLKAIEASLKAEV
jgi:hypothetical protein